MRTYPYTIENGAGERLTFARRLQDSGGDWLEGDNVVQPGAGPPMHTHYFQEEVVTVLEGRIGIQRPGEEPVFAEAGETVAFAPGEAHRFWNAGTTELRFNGLIKPAGNVEYFLSAFFASQKANGGRRPDLFDAAFLIHRYRKEFGMHEIPMLVQRLVFPLIVAVGHALGKYRKYAGAPEPMEG